MGKVDVSRQVEDIYPLSPMQQGMLFHNLYAPGGYVAQLSCTFHGALNIAAFERTWQQVVDRHQILRTSFHWEGLDAPLQIISRQVKLPVEQQDWRALSPDEQQARLSELLRAERERGFEFTKPPLMRLLLLRLSEESYRFVWTTHHILHDGWSMPLLFKEVVAFYEAFNRGEDLVLEQSRPYRDYIVWLQQQDMSRAESFWRETLKGFNRPTPLPPDITTNGSSKREADLCAERLDLPVEATAALQAFARQHQLTLNTLVQGAWSLLLSRYSGEQDVVFGAVVSGRPPDLVGAESMIGLFINTLPVRVAVSADETVLSWLKRLQEKQAEARQYEYSPLVEIQRWSEVPRGKPLFESLLAFQNYPVDEARREQSASIGIRDLDFYEHNSYPLALTAGVGRTLQLQLLYDRGRFRAAMIKRTLEHMQAALEGIIAEPGRRLPEVPLLSRAERHQLLVEWNRTQAHYPQDICVHQLFEQQVERTPDNVAVVCEGEQLTYRELNRHADQLAHHLQALGVGPEVTVAIFMERTLEMLVALLGVLKAGGTYVPLDPAHPRHRLAFILADAQTPVLLTQQHLVASLPEQNCLVLCLDQPWQSSAHQGLENRPSAVGASNHAYVIYTSGSTGQPKGVKISHRSLVNYLWWAKDVYLQGQNLSFALYSSLAFDLTVTSIYTPLLTGNRVVIYRQDAREGVLARILEENQVEVVKLTPSHLRLIKGRDNRGSRIRRLIVGGEALQTDLAREVLASFGGRVEIDNEYGPTEATVGCMLHRFDPQRDRAASVPIGKPAANVQLYVLDEQLQPVAENVPGQLYIGGDGLADGYLNRAELTAERFVVNPFIAGQRIYRSGDVVRRLTDGTLEFVGREDEQVKFHGYRVELGEIRTALNSHSRVRDSLVVLRQDRQGQEVLVAYYVSREELEARELRAHLLERVIAETVPQVYVHLRKMPLTLNGKINHEALPAWEEQREKAKREYEGPRTPVEELLCGVWCEVLGVERVGIEDNFFELGGHSLLATQVISRVRETFGVEVGLKVLFESPTVASFAEKIEAASDLEQGHQVAPIERVSRDVELPLSFAQQRPWFLDQFEPGSSAFNIPAAVRLRGQLNTSALDQSLTEVVRRHEVLRTNFVSVGGRAVQVIHDAQPMHVPLIDLSEMAEAEREAEARLLAADEARRPFELSRGPLLRVSLVRLAAEEHVLLWTMHHIISDGWSMGVLVREVATLYRAFSEGRPSPLEELPIQYADFAAWQRGWLQGEVLESKLAYWKQQLAGAPPTLELPLDYPRPALQTFRGAQQPFTLSATLSESLKALSRREGVTLFMTLLAAFKTLLYRYTGQEDINIGSYIANRNRAEIEPLIGFFVNTLVLRTDISGNPSFSELLRRVREVCLGAYAHQDIPFEKLVEELQPDRSLSHTPLFQVMFVLQNTPMPSLELPQLSSSPLAAEGVRAHFDLTLWMNEERRGLSGSLEYNVELFHAHKINQLLKHFQTLLEAVAENPERPIADYSLLSESELHQLLAEFNDTAREYPESACAHHLFEARVERAPDATAVVFEEQRLTYRQLNERANQLARHLRALGAGPEVLVGICVERSLEMIVGLLGILKAGAAYVPLDPAYPKQRLAHMLMDADVKVLLTQQGLRQSLPEHGSHVVCLDRDWEIIAREDASNLDVEISADNLSYIIYTSGSTGSPKGVMTRHRSLTAYTNTAKTVYVIEPNDRILQFASINFDASAEEIYPCLAQGATLVLRTEPMLSSVRAFLQACAAHDVTVLNLPTAYWHELTAALEAEGLSLHPAIRLLIIGGERALPERMAVWQQHVASSVRVVNTYGPTEATIVTSMWEVTPSRLDSTHEIPIGRAIANSQLYILDAYQQPVPVGVKGELYVGGDGLARGYLNHAELTAERFVPNPFASEAGSRLYRTGDLARYLADGDLEFCGRLDHQVKLRGFRIELGEIEAVLSQHPAVKDVVVVAREDSPGDKRLVAYLVPDYSASPLSSDLSQQAEHIAQWQKVYDDNYSHSPASRDLSFDFDGWNSSYTGEPIPQVEMQEWVNSTVERIRSLRPSRVLEIGCGTGLLLFPLAPSCSSYLATDFSSEVIDYLRRLCSSSDSPLPHVSLLQRTADDFSAIPPSSLDSVILNSVVQYFPSIDYLLSVLAQAISSTSDGGSIFLGDIRSLPLLEALQTSIQVAQAPEELRREQVRQRVQALVREEEELVIDPEFFLALEGEMERVRAVEVHHKRGRYQNELTRFRYDVVLHIGSREAGEPVSAVQTMEWEERRWKPEEVAELVEQNSPEVLLIRGVENARLGEEALSLRWLSGEGEAETLRQWRDELRQASTDEAAELRVDPEQWWELEQRLEGYRIDVRWSPQSAPDTYDVVFVRHDEDAAKRLPLPLPGHSLSRLRHWNSYATHPLQARITRSLVSQLRHLAQSRLPDYMLPSAFLLLDQLPLSPNGKLDRRALPAPEPGRTARGSRYQAPRSASEEIVAGIYREVLGVEEVGREENFFELGGHSLLATQVMSRVREWFGVEVKLRRLFEEPTVRGLSEVIEEMLRTGEGQEVSPIRPVSREEDLEASFAQQRLWFLDQLEPENAFYNIATAARLSGHLDISVLERTLAEVIRRHESLRTTFALSNGKPVQVISEAGPVSLPLVDLSYLPEAERETKARQLAREEARLPFDLSRGPLLRVSLLRLAEEEHVLLWTIHHIISDGWSMGVLVREVTAIYEAFSAGKPSPLPELPIQYADYAVWQRERLDGEVLDDQLRYWREQLRGVAVLELPTDRPRPAVQSYRGATAPVKLSRSVSAGLRGLSQREGVTLFMTLLGAFQTLLMRLSGQEDISVGTFIAGRTRAETEALIGFFINNLALRTDLSGDPTFRELLKRVREVTLGAYGHQEVPFEKVLEEVETERDLSRTPLFQVAFTLQNYGTGQDWIDWGLTPESPLPSSALSLRPFGQQDARAEFDMTRGLSNFDLTLWMSDINGELIGDLSYNVDLFDAATIERILNHFYLLLEGVVANPEQRLSELPLLTEAEQHQLTAEWGHTGKDYSLHVTVHEMFKRQVEREPDKVAVVYRDCHLTFQELDERSGQLANLLKELKK